jgi:hypothetical protein
LDAYSKFVRWTTAARQTPDLLQHGYLPTHSAFASIIREHRMSYQGDISRITKQAAIRNLHSRLVYQDSRVALAVLWMLLEGDKLAPQVDTLFHDWERPQCDLEFGDIGIFVRNPGGSYSYEGGESKFDMSGINF